MEQAANVAKSVKSRGFMYSADADGRGRTRTFNFFFFLIFFLAYIDLRAQLERDPESDRLGHPPRIMILWRSIESTGTYINKNIHYL